MELDPNLAESRIVAGDRIFFREWNWGPGEEEFRRALELDPHSELAAFHLGICLDSLRKWDESIAVFENALRVDPFSRLLQLTLLQALVHAHRYDEAIVQFKKAIELAPEDPAPYRSIGNVYADMKRDKDAGDAYLKADSLSRFNADDLKSLQRAFETAGVRGYWRRLLELRLSKEGEKHPFGLALLYVRVRDNDRAMDLLEQTYRLRRPNMAWINSIIELAPLRNDPRFQDLLHRMDFPPSTSTARESDLSRKR
jgi:tetratricopeptide (TPR) repeat protein